MGPVMAGFSRRKSMIDALRIVPRGDWYCSWLELVFFFVSSDFFYTLTLALLCVCEIP